MTSESQAREVAMKWILTVAGVYPLVRIFRKAFEWRWVADFCV